MAHAYTALSRAQLAFDYLHTNSTSHEFLFGALAEIVDNSRDAASKNLDIYTVPDDNLRGGTMLYFLDDGEGMDPTETANVITFGLSHKKAMDSTQIGQYGNGLKSASMRIANDMIVFTKKKEFMTCLMLCRTFHEEEKIKEVIVPLPSFYVESKKPNYTGKGKGIREKHDLEMGLILKYSPFHTEEEFFKQFDSISQSGTLVILYNLKLLDNGLTELDFITDPEDILIAGIDLTVEKNLVPERYSLRAFVALLYSDPRMKIHIQKKKVRLYRFVTNLFKPRSYTYTSARFKTRSKNEANKAELEYKAAKQKLVEAEGRAKEMERTVLQSNTSKNDRAKLRTLQVAVDELKVEVRNKQTIADKKQRFMKDPKTLNFIFGIHLNNRKFDGFFIYNCNRLIKMYERAGPLLENRENRGVVGIVNVPYLVLEPTANKQDFTDAKEYRHLLKVMGEHMEQYWRDVELGHHTVELFWEAFGYPSDNWETMPSMDPKYLGRRARESKICLQCDLCLKWRIIPYASSNAGKVFPDNWICSNNPDSARNRCNSPEEKLIVPEGKFQKMEKSREELDSDINDKMKRLEEKKKIINQRDFVTSSRSAKSVMAEVAQRKVDMAGRSVEPGRILETRPKSPETPKSTESVGRSPERGRKSPSESPRRRFPRPEERETESLASKRKRVSSNRNSTDSTNDDDVRFVPHYHRSPRKKKKSTWDHHPGDSNNSSESNAVATDDWWPELSDDEMEVPTTIEVGSRVEINVRDKWYVGTALKKNGPDFIVRLDKLPSAKHDKRINPNSDKIRMAQVPQSDKVQQEMPSSSTASNGSHHNTDELLEQLSRCFKTCLHFFMPPKWHMSKDKIQNLSRDELLSFPFDDFFKKYEDGLRNLIAGFQEEAYGKAEEAKEAKKEAEDARAKLKHTNQLIARLLNSIHDECNLDPEADSDKVDELLQACVAQAEMPSTQPDQVTTSSL